jgi:multicomponent Na+:H+ antiporter subunit G
MTTSELGIFVLASVGVFFMVVSSVGVLRLPDVYTRMHAASSAITIGIGCILLAAGFTYGQWGLVRMLLLIVLFYITGPIATTAMARAAYRTDYEGRLVLNYDELADHNEQPDGSSLRPNQPG